MGTILSCNAKQVKDSVTVIKSIINELVELGKQDDSEKTYKCLLTMMYNLNQYDKNTQKLILDLVAEKVNKE